jgi:hypothetical protein
MAYLLYLSKSFEFVCRYCHELWYTSEIPVGIGYHGVPHVSGQRQHLLIDIHALNMPEHHATNDEGVPQIVDAWSIVSTAIDPSQLITQSDEDLTDLVQAQAMSA